MPPQGFRIGDKVRLADGDIAYVVPDRPGRADPKVTVQVMRQYNIDLGKPEISQFESVDPQTTTKA
jgi:SRSO17 transposase